VLPHVLHLQLVRIEGCKTLVTRGCDCMLCFSIRQQVLAVSAMERRGGVLWLMPLPLRLLLPPWSV
jgi:hypothetical protein